MLKEIIIFVFTVAVCRADTPAPSRGVYCGEIPAKINECLGMPTIISADIVKNCKGDTECGKLTCAFAESGWLNGNKVDKKKVSDHFDTFATAHPAWSAAVAHSKAACLGDRDLPAQGVFINCPAYDAMHCALTSFIKSASTSQWRSGVDCDRAREYAAACPVCPSDCFAPQVPNDSCHACRLLPRSA